ncbi:MAG: tetratricopeptide repeat protein [Hyphomicrobiaceae bacterium]|nr:tetratricopeptide repeat protein [Hyphomicrobiaceae bacterium]
MIRNCSIIKAARPAHFARRTAHRVSAVAARTLCLAIAGLAALSTVAGPIAADPVARDPASDCFSEDTSRRISGCSALIDGGTSLTPSEKSMAHALRALAYSLQGKYAEALADYDIAIDIRPDFDVALNNRAWSLFKTGRNGEAMADVERALKIAPWSPHALDTRAHLHHAEGRLQKALSDYLLAMRFGGERIIKLYQCGLEANGLFKGPIDGLESEPLRLALATCVRDRDCDPLPPDEECRRPTS